MREAPRAPPPVIRLTGIKAKSISGTSTGGNAGHTRSHDNLIDQFHRKGRRRDFPLFEHGWGKPELSRFNEAADESRPLGTPLPVA
jgi:hypothetical protein